MIGRWQRFGEGEPPYDGEGLVYIRAAGDFIDALEGRLTEVVFAVHRHGALHEQGGCLVGAIPYGSWWTSLPTPPAQPASLAAGGGQGGSVVVAPHGVLLAGQGLDAARVAEPGIEPTS